TFGQGQGAVLEVPNKVVSDVTEGLISTKKDVKAVKDAFERGAAEYADATVGKVKSYIGKLAAAAMLDGIDFAKVIKQVQAQHRVLKNKKEKRRTLVEAMVKGARVQLEQPDKQLTQTQVSELCQPFGSKKPKVKAITRMVAAVDELTDAEAKRLMAALE